MCPKHIHTLYPIYRELTYMEAKYGRGPGYPFFFHSFRVWVTRTNEWLLCTTSCTSWPKTRSVSMMFFGGIVYNSSPFQSRIPFEKIVTARYSLTKAPATPLGGSLVRVNTPDEPLRRSPTTLPPLYYYYFFVLPCQGIVIGLQHLVIFPIFFCA